MILNNFKPLLSFRNNLNFKNVLGETIKKTVFLGGQIISEAANGHSGKGSYSDYSYTTTTGSNSYIKEQESYTWGSVVSKKAPSFNADSPYYVWNGFTLFVGTGDTAETAEDYKLANAVELAVTAASCQHADNGKTFVTRTFQNNTESAVTIKEVGLYVFRCAGAVDNRVVMIGRKVLDTPVTINVGDVYTFTYSVDLSEIN